MISIPVAPALNDETEASDLDVALLPSNNRVNPWRVNDMKSFLVVPELEENLAIISAACLAFVLYVALEAGQGAIEQFCSSPVAVDAITG